MDRNKIMLKYNILFISFFHLTEPETSKLQFMVISPISRRYNAHLMKDYFAVSSLSILIVFLLHQHPKKKSNMAMRKTWKLKLMKMRRTFKITNHPLTTAYSLKCLSFLPSICTFYVDFVCSLLL